MAKDVEQSFKIYTYLNWVQVLKVIYSKIE